MFIYMVASTHKTCPLVSPSEKYAHWCPLSAKMVALSLRERNLISRSEMATITANPSFAAHIVDCFTTPYGI
jgi:hypothetical protein